MSGDRIVESLVIHERLFDEDPGLPEDIIPDKDVSYEIIVKGTQRGKDLLVDSHGYSYNLKDKRGPTTRWSCSVRNKRVRCTAMVSQKGEDFHEGTSRHIHLPDHARAVTAKITKRAKEIAVVDHFTSACDIVKSVRQQVDESTCVGTIREDFIARRVCRKRWHTMRQDEPNVS